MSIVESLVSQCSRGAKALLLTAQGSEELTNTGHCAFQDGPSPFQVHHKDCICIQEIQRACVILLSC